VPDENAHVVNRFVEEGKIFKKRSPATILMGHVATF